MFTDFDCMLRGLTVLYCKIWWDILVTGIGREAARDLAQRGARVIMACRNLQKASQVASQWLFVVELCMAEDIDLELCKKCKIEMPAIYFVFFIRWHRRDHREHNSGGAGTGHFLTRLCQEICCQISCWRAQVCSHTSKVSPLILTMPWIFLFYGLPTAQETNQGN